MGPDSDAGIGVIDSDYMAGAMSLSKQAFAEQRVCHKTEDGWDCEWETYCTSNSGDPDEAAKSYS